MREKNRDCPCVPMNKNAQYIKILRRDVQTIIQCQLDIKKFLIIIVRVE
jgi:hypothetical protein